MFFDSCLTEFFVTFPVSPNESQHMTLQQSMDIFFCVHTYPAFVVILPFYLITGAAGKTHDKNMHQLIITVFLHFISCICKYQII